MPMKKTKGVKFKHKLVLIWGWISVEIDLKNKPQ